MNVSITDRWRTMCHRLAATLLTMAAVAWPTISAAQEAEKAAEGPTGGLPPWNEVLDALLDFKFGTIPIWRIVASLLLLGLGFALRKFLLQWMMSPLDKLLERTETTYDDQLLEAVQPPLLWSVYLVALYFALLVPNLPGALMQVASLVLQTVGTVMVAWMANKLINVLVAILGDYSQNTHSEVDDYLVPVVGRVVRVALIGLVVIVIIQQWGYDVTSLLAGLGLGGLAFALAAKPTLANWFGSIMIFTDRPFVVGDRIEIDAGEGIVEEVGLRSTRIRTREDSLSPERQHRQQRHREPVGPAQAPDQHDPRARLQYADRDGRDDRRAGPRGARRPRRHRRLPGDRPVFGLRRQRPRDLRRLLRQHLQPGRVLPHPPGGLRGVRPGRRPGGVVVRLPVPERLHGAGRRGVGGGHVEGGADL